MQCHRYSDELKKVWDDFVINVAWNGTFLHTKEFLSYHADKFIDLSMLVYDDNERLIAVFPAAVHPLQKNVVVSHPGSTFGGLVASSKCNGESCIQTLMGILDHYRKSGFKQLIYKATPHIYHKTPFNDDLYVLFRLNFKRVRCDLSATIQLLNRPPLTKGRKSELSKAIKCGVELVEGICYLEDIYNLIKDNLAEKYHKKPVHELSDLTLLHSRFPENVKFLAAKLDSKIVAGLIMFNFRNVAHTQYIASSDLGRNTGALDALIENTINESLNSEYSYFDFGISNEQEGLILNEGLYRYKRSFGSGSVAHEFYALDL